MNDLAHAARLLSENDNYTILIHAYPDGDAIGGGYALCRALRFIGKKANVACTHKIPDMYSFITNDFETMDFVTESFLSVDVADLNLLGGSGTEFKNKVLLSIDHHGTNNLYADYSVVDPLSSSACEIVLSIIRLLGVPIDVKIAECIYTGISTDTGCFKFSNTTAATHRAAADMMDAGIDTQEINRIMFDTKTRSRIKLEQMAVENLEFFFDGKLAYITITNEMRALSGAMDSDLEGITSIPRQVAGVKIGVTFRQRDDGDYKISVRSHLPYDAAKICTNFGGGGHICAAGCTVSGNLDEIKKKMLSLCRDALGAV